MKYLIVLLALSAQLSAQIPNEGFEEWEVVDGIEQPKYWSTNNAECCLTVEKVSGADAISGSHSMKVSSSALSIEGALPGRAHIAFQPGTVYRSLSAKARIDSMEMGEVVITVREWSNGALREIGKWSSAAKTDGVISIATEIAQTEQAVFLEIDIEARNTQSPVGSIGYAEAIIDDLELSVVSSTAAAERRRLQVFPNPSSGLFNFVLPEGFTAGTLSVIDARGQAVLRRAISRAAFSGGIDLSGLPSGVYFLELRPALGSVELRYGQRVVKVD